MIGAILVISSVVLMSLTVVTRVKISLCSLDNPPIRMIP